MKEKTVKQQKKGKFEQFISDNEKTIEVGVTVLVGIGKLGIDFYKAQRKIDIYEKELSKAGLKLFKA